MMQNESKIWTWLRNCSGFNDYAIAAIMGNIEAESAGYPNNLEDRAAKELGMTDAQYTAAVDNGSYSRADFSKDNGVYGGYGLCQWTYYTRKLALYDYAKTKGTSIGDLEMQLSFILKELTGESEFASTLKALRSATDIATPCKPLLEIYENPTDKSAKVLAYRVSLAQAIYDRNHGTATTTTEAAASTSNLITEITNELLDIQSKVKELIEKCQTQS